MAEEFKIQGNDAFSKNQFEKALKLYQKAIDKDPNQPTYYTNKASVYIKLEQYQNALIECQNALKNKPDNIRALVRASICCTKLGDLTKAFDYLEEAEKHTDQDQAMKQGFKDVEEAKNNLKDFEKFEKDNNFPQALYYIDQLLAKCDGCWNFKIKKIETLLKNGDLAKCEELCMYLMQKQNNDHAILKYWMAKCIYYSGRTEESERLLRECLQQNPDDHSSKFLLKCIKHYEKMKDQANQLFTAKKYAEAIQAYTECLKLNQFNKNYNSIILSNRSACYMGLKEYIKALTDINKSISLKPDFAKAYVRRGNIRVALEEFSEALTDYNKAKELNPRYPDIENILSSAQNAMQNSKRKDYYKILDVEKGATEAEIKKAYRKAALKWHPDKNSETEEMKIEAEKKFKDVNEAYDVLSDSNKKAAYDNGMDPNSMGGFGGMGGIDPTKIFQMFSGGDGFSSFFGGGNGGNGSNGSRRSGGMPSFMSGGMPSFMSGSFPGMFSFSTSGGPGGFNFSSDSSGFGGMPDFSSFSNQGGKKYRK